MPIDLANEPGPLKVADATIKDDLDDLQGNILNGHGRDHATHLFLRFSDAHVAEARALLSGLAQGSVTSAFGQLEAAKAFDEHKTDGGLFTHVALSADGYRALQVALLPSGANPRQAPAAVDGYADVFSLGMKERQLTLEDPPAPEWEPSFRDAIHALVILASDDDGEVTAAVTKLRGLLGADPATAIGSVVAEEKGFVQRRVFAGGDQVDGEPVEHFGFMDNISQPAFLDKQIKEEIAGWDPVAPPRLVLVKDPNGRGFGSFLVFRKLEQNVRGFWHAVERLSKKVESTRAVVGAMAVGRYENGTPVVLADKADPGISRTNRFNYDVDPNGNRCPFQAHTRKTNPRLESARVGGFDGELERGHRIARRGIPYPETERKDFEAETSKLPVGGVGMLFMCYQSDIWEQFEFQQGAWCNNPSFMHPGDAAVWAGVPAYSMGTGIDAIVGQQLTTSSHPTEGDERPRNWPAAWDKPPIRTLPVAKFVTMKGGEYFFSPSISGLRSLDPGAPAIQLKAD